MSQRSEFLLAVIVIFSIILGSCNDIAYISGEGGLELLVYGNISDWNEFGVINFTVAGEGGTTSQTDIPVDLFREEIQDRVQVGNRSIIDLSHSITKKSKDYPSPEITIDQVRLIYEHLADRWAPAPDPHGFEYPRYAWDSISQGEGDYSGSGDCDDFAIVIASLIENMGGTTRIILANGLTGGHAFTEVYLGKLNTTEFERIDGWLRDRYHDGIHYHINDTTDEVWLNLDWGDNPLNPSLKLGEKIIFNSEYIPIFISPNVMKTVVKPSNEAPVAVIRGPGEGNANQKIVFDGSQSTDPDGVVDIREYKWDFGDYSDPLQGRKVSHTYQKGNNYTVTLTLVDTKEEKDTDTLIILINEPPVANFTFWPEEPEVGQIVTFDASNTTDKEGGKLEYEWSLPGETPSSSKIIIPGISIPWNFYNKNGSYVVTLNVTDKKGANSECSRTIKVNLPPEAHFDYKTTEHDVPTIGETIIFDASGSRDPDGKIENWLWDFGEDENTDNGSEVRYNYSKGGSFTIKLEVIDDNNSSDEYSKIVRVNWPPVADFTFDPPNPTSGRSIQFDASKSSDLEEGDLEYRWNFGDGLPGGTGDSIEYDYNPASGRNYTVTLTVTDEDKASNSTSKVIYVSGTNERPKILYLKPDVEQPVEAGTAITWTADAEDPDADSLLYMFLLDDHPVTEWARAESWLWRTNQADVGSHRIEVRVRDGKHAGWGGYDDNYISSFYLYVAEELHETDDAVTITGLSYSDEDEWVEIANTGMATQDFTFWVITDEENYTYVFAEGFILVPGAVAKVHTGQGFDTETDLYWGLDDGLVWDDGEVATLFDANGEIVAQYPKLWGR